MNIFLTTFGLIFVTEIADKSRVAGFLLATTFAAPWRVFFGMTLGYALLEAVSVSLGGLIPGWISVKLLEISIGSIFILLGILALFFSDSLEDHASTWLGKIKHWGPLVVSFVVTAASEIGDRTQIAAAALSAESAQPWKVFGGAMCALIVLNALTVWFGNNIAQRFSMRKVHRFSGVVFILFGILILARQIIK